MAYQIDPESCIACGACEAVCPSSAIIADTAYRIDADKCVECGACAEACPDGLPKMG